MLGIKPNDKIISNSLSEGVNSLVLVLSKINIKLDLLIAVFVVITLFFGVAADAAIMYYVFSFVPIALVFYAICFILNHKITAMFYFVALFVGMVNFSPANLVNIMLADLLFPGLVLSLLFSNKLTKEDICSPIFISLSVLCGFAILSALFGIFFTPNYFPELLNTNYTIAFHIYRFLQLPVVYLFVINSMKVSNSVEKIIIYSVLFQMFLVFLQLFVFQTNSDGRMRATGTLFENHMVIGLYIMTFIPLLIVCLRNKKDFRAKVFWLTLAVYSVYIIIAASARSVLLGLTAAVAALVFFNLRFNKKAIGIVVSSVIIAFFVFRFMPVQETIDRTFSGGNANVRSLDVSSYSRLFIWRGSLTVFENSSLFHKITGKGPGTFAGLDLIIMQLDGRRQATAAHNNFLHTLIEIGIIGTILFLAHFVIIIFYFLKKKNFTALVFACVTIGLLVSGFTQESFWVNGGNHYWMYYITILAIFVSMFESKRKENYVFGER